MAGASFSGWEEGSAKRPRKGCVGSSGRVERLHCCTRTLPQVSKPVPPQFRMKATFWSGQQTSPLGPSCGEGAESSHTECPELTGLG